MNSKQTIKIWSRVLMEICTDLSEVQQKKKIIRLGEILKAKKKGYLLAKIVENAFTAIDNQTKSEITLAHPQAPKLVDSLKKKIAAKFDGEGNAKVVIDPGIIGGFIAKTSQYLLDASVKSRLEQLKKTYQS